MKLLGCRYLIALALCLGLAISCCSAQENRLLSFSTHLNGRNQVPTPIDTEAFAIFTINVDVSNQQAFYVFRINHVANYTMSHLHLGDAQTNGPPIVPIWPGLPVGAGPMLPTLPREAPAMAQLDSMVFRGTILPSSLLSPDGVRPVALGFTEFVSNIQNGLVYANIHTSPNPAGEIRGQLMFRGRTDNQWQG